MVVDPLREMDCMLVNDGACAAVVTSATRAKDLRQRPVSIMAAAQACGPLPQTQWDSWPFRPVITESAAKYIAPRLFGMAGVTPKDINVAEIYDSYPVYQLIGFEELGLCERGEAGEIYLRGETWPGGRIPTTTDGGMLSKGHIGAGGGVSLLVEAARQLMGKAGDRQVPGATFAVETGTGGTYMDAQVTILGTEIP